MPPNNLLSQTYVLHGIWALLPVILPYIGVEEPINGVIDIDKTVERLKKAENLLNSVHEIV